MARREGQTSPMCKRLPRFVVSDFDVLPFDATAAAWYARERLRLNIVKPNVDAMIAAIVVANDATLVTRNVRHFEVFPSLRIVRW